MTDATATAAADVAPARQPDDSVELYFNGSRELPRRLIVIRTRYYLTVATYPLGTKRHRSFGYTSLAREDDRIHLHVNEHGDCGLWLDSTAFDITKAEFAEIAEKLGIRITRHGEAQS